MPGMGLTMPGTVLMMNRNGCSRWAGMVLTMARNTQRVGEACWLRLTGGWTAAAKSVFCFDIQGSVENPTHAGLPALLLGNTVETEFISGFRRLVFQAPRALSPSIDTKRRERMGQK